MPEQQALVLVAHNDDAVGDALQFALRLENLEVHVHRSGSDLLTNPELYRASCLILRHHMPDMDSPQVMHFLHERQLFVPAILLTANATPELRRQAERAGIRMVLEKPILDNVLLDSVRSIIPHPPPFGKPAAT